MQFALALTTIAVATQATKIQAPKGVNFDSSNHQAYTQVAVQARECSLIVDNDKVKAEKGAVVGQTCTGAGACLLIEGKGRYTCEIDPGYFTAKDVCTKDTGIWCAKAKAAKTVKKHVKKPTKTVKKHAKKPIKTVKKISAYARCSKSKKCNAARKAGFRAVFNNCSKNKSCSAAH